MRLEVLRYFLEVARQGSIRKASEHVNLAPSALSRHISILEHTVGASLFERRARGMVLTEEGAILQKYALRTVSSVDLVKLAIEEIQGLRSGVIRIFAIEIFASSILYPTIREFLVEHSGVSFQVEVITKDNNDVVHGLLRDETDIGLMYKLAPNTDFDHIAEFETPFAVIASPQHPLAAKNEISVGDLEGTPIATLSSSNATRRITESAMNGVGLKLDYTLSVNSIEMAKEFARTGMGVTVLPAIAARIECNSGELVAIPLQEWTLRRVRATLCTHHGRNISPTASAFLELLKTRCRSN